jgi:glycosyltransferase involved in cell wall biosynthesis
MKKLLWFGNIGDTSSFSRVSESFLKEAQKDFEITVLTNAGANQNKYPYKIVKIGSDTTSIKLDEYLYMTQSMNSLESKIKYSIIQLIDIIKEQQPDFIIICNGIYEVKYLVSLINRDFIKNSKLIVWTPIDYIPTNVDPLFDVDILLTMTPIMADILKNLAKKSTTNCIIDWLGHGSNFCEDSSKDLSKESSKESRKALITSINNQKSKLWTSVHDISEDDIIILNANNCVPRKRLDLTIEIFNELKKKYSKKYPKNKLKLWLHTDLKKLNNIINGSLIDKNSVILSNNNVSDSFLRDIYKVCNIGLQTSTGEGWSLTNCEHSLVNPNAIQVVPNFLACSYNFSDNRGLLVPVKITKQISEDKLPIVVGIIDKQEAIKCLSDVIDGVCSCSKRDHLTWESVYERFLEIVG